MEEKTIVVEQVEKQAEEQIVELSLEQLANIGGGAVVNLN